MKGVLMGVLDPHQLVTALGDWGNIAEVEPCSLRIRVQVKDPHKVDEQAIRNLNPLAVVQSGSYVQIVTGPDADVTAKRMREAWESSNPEALKE